MKAVFLGRFQPFHNGHKKVVEKYRDEYEDFSVLIGSSEKEESKDNPLSFEERKEVIHECLPELDVQGLEDETKDKEGNRKWIENLEKKTEADLLISGNNLVKKIVEKHSDLEIQEPEMHDPEIYSGTEIRRRVRSGEEWRYLTPKCAQSKLEEFEEKIRDAGKDFDFEPGWKRENAYHGTAEE